MVSEAKYSQYPLDEQNCCQAERPPANVLNKAEEDVIHFGKVEGTEEESFTEIRIGQLQVMLRVRSDTPLKLDSGCG